MKVVKVPLAREENKEVWVVVHSLSVDDGQCRRLRPIHAFTLLAQSISDDPGSVFRLCLTLENKLQAVLFKHKELVRSYNSIGDPIYSEPYIRDYDDEQLFLGYLEAYLQSIYTSLEIAALINRHINNGLPVGFRRQAKKFDKFSFSEWQWLPHFYDIRTELAHFNTPLPHVSDGKLLIEFVRGGKYNLFEKGRYEISMDSIFEYAFELFNLLDAWAIGELVRVDPEMELNTYRQVGVHKPLQHYRSKAKDILGLLEGS